MVDEQQTLTIEEGAASKERGARVGVLLLFCEGAHAGPFLYPGIGRRTIGRQVDQPIYIDDPSLSRAHAELELKDLQAWVRDLGSHNGTFVNGKSVKGRLEIGFGDIVRCGKSLLTIVDDIDAYLGWPQMASVGALVGGPAMARLVHRVEIVAPLRADVLIAGETGTGKELVAELVHQASGRGGPLVAVNCAAVPEPLFESELFGVRRGAFTGATDDRPGLLRQAHRGTVFLDEVGDLPTAVQPKLLRALEQRVVRAVGADREAKLDIRVVSATHRDLRKLVDQGTFREDLFHRLHGTCIEVPALRNRREDVVPLMHHALTRIEEGRGAQPQPTAPFVEQLLLQRWSGNVRELFQVVGEAVVEARVDGSNELLSRHIPRGPRHEGDKLSSVRSALLRAGGNVAACAADLGIARGKLYEILKQAGLKAEDFRS
ncbi:MAG: sigma 54-interacting transcriptional regulator [Deltaproteobacteria bacterium]|nr:sigma 54-interacting transcriptional regulator [Deltaproteobacteria bacterium]